MHKRNMSIAACTGLLELLLALLGRLIVPVARVNVVGDDAVAQVLHGGQDVAAGGEVRGTQVGGLLADDVAEGLLEAGHLLGELGGGHGAEVLGVGPCVRGDLVAGFEGVLEGGALVVDAAWLGLVGGYVDGECHFQIEFRGHTVESSCHEEGCLGSASIQGVNELLGVSRWAVVVCESNLTRSITFGDNLPNG